MAYDAGMLYAVLREIKDLAAGGAKIEKIYQPSGDEVTLTFRAGGRSQLLCLNAGTASPRIALSGVSRENPAVAPMFCMLLRKHLAGARLIAAEQIGYERVARFCFSGYDEMGYPTEKFLVAEVMGKYSNLMLLDADDRITAVLRPVDFSTSRLRQVLPGMKYELPPPQDKRPPMDETREGFLSAIADFPPDRPADKFITSTYLGTATQVAREIVYLASGDASALISELSPERLWQTFSEWFGALAAGEVSPTLVLDPSGVPKDFAYRPMTYFGKEYRNLSCGSFAEMLDRFFEERDRCERIRQRASDLLRLLSGAEGRLERKLEAQRLELADCRMGEEWRRRGDLVIANLYRLRRGDRLVSLTDYTVDPPTEVELELDPRRAPSENAERFYKLYRKAKTAEQMLTQQIARSEEELRYLAGVRSFLDRAETEQDLTDLREELYRSGYASRMKNYTPQRQAKPSKPTEAVTPAGYRLLIGRNNLQNEHLTFKVAKKDDLWFHAKGVPGSHVILLCDGEEPPAEDYTFAAELAAGASQAAKGESVPVDYTRVRNIRKPPAARPGYVTYKTNYTAYVTPKKLRDL